MELKMLDIINDTISLKNVQVVDVFDRRDEGDKYISIYEDKKRIGDACPISGQSMSQNGTLASGRESQAPDPFDPASLRISQDLTSALGVKKILTTVPVKKPSKEWFVRVHPSEEYRVPVGVIELKEDNEVYLVVPALQAELAAESTFSARVLLTTINRQGVVFLWPVKLPAPDGRRNEWNDSAMAAASLATKNWVRIQANMSLGAYEVSAFTGSPSEPEWKLPPFGELLRIAFKDRFIDSLNHPVLKRLRGEI